MYDLLKNTLRPVGKTLRLRCLFKVAFASPIDFVEGWLLYVVPFEILNNSFGAYGKLLSISKYRKITAVAYHCTRLQRTKIFKPFMSLGALWVWASAKQRETVNPK